MCVAEISGNESQSVGAPLSGKSSNGKVLSKNDPVVALRISNAKSLAFSNPFVV